MKRYWKLILLVLFITASLSTFYLRGVSAGPGVPQFMISTVSGDESVTKNLVIEGLYQPGEGGYAGDVLKITDKGTETYRDYSYFDRMDGKFDNRQIAEYQEKYRNFMRGTGVSIANFYEDENSLLFAGEKIDHSRTGSQKASIEVKVLDKKTEKIEKFTVDVPDRFYYFYVENVYLEDNRLFVSADTMPYMEAESDNGGTYFVYEIDMENRAMVEGKGIVQSYKEEKFDYWNTYLRADESMESSPYMVFRLQGETYDSNGVRKDYKELEVVHNLVTGEGTLLDLEKGDDGSYYSLDVHKDSIYRHYQQEDGLIIERYDAESKEMVEDYSLAFDENMQYQVRFSNGKAYVVYGEPNDLNIMIEVIDLLSGEHIYKGSVEATGNQKPLKNSSLELYGFEVY